MSSSRRSSVGCGANGSLGRLAAQQPEQTAHLHQCLPAGRGHPLDRTGSLVGRGIERVSGAIGKGDHDREVVRDDVMHLASDAGALGGGPELGLLVALTLEPSRLLLQGDK